MYHEKEKKLNREIDWTDFLLPNFDSSFGNHFTKSPWRIAVFQVFCLTFAQKSYTSTPSKTITPPSSPIYLLPPSSSQTLVCGDCDGSGFVDILDAYRASHYASGLANLTDEEFYYCNVVGVPGSRYLYNSQVSILDALYIARYVVGLIPELNCGRPIVFIKWATYNSTGDSIVRIDHDGSNEVVLRTSSEYFYSGPVLSPDSTKIAYDQVNLSRNHSSEIVIMDVNGQNDYVLTPFRTRSPSWSPDGTKIAFEAVHRNESYYGDEIVEIDVINSDGTNRIQLTNNTASDGYPQWSPDGSKILYSSSPTFLYPFSNAEIYSMNTDGSNNTKLTNHSASDGSATWSPDGKNIFFTRFYSLTYFPYRRQEVYIMNSDGTNPVLIINSSILLDFLLDPFWSSDGSILFSNYTGFLYSDIYRMNASGGNIIRLTNYSDGDEVLTPNGG